MFREVLYIFLLIGISSSSPITGRIVNGTNAKEGEFPYAVSLRSRGKHICGASIIGNKWILTAAHCLMRVESESLTVQYGANQISSTGPTIAKIKAIIPHEDFNPRKALNDIAIFELKEFIKFNEKVQPVKLPKQDFEVPGGTPTVLVGWGLQESGGSVQKNLQKVDLVTFSDEDCYKRHNGQTYPTNICAGVPEGGKGQCSGDSGGPLTYEGVQLGIVSWSRKPCAIAPYPGVFTKVSRYINWISETTGLKF